MPETRRGWVRIASNYVRLLTTLSFGLVLTPVLFHWLGEAGVGVVLLVGANIGLTAIFQDMLSNSLTRELTTAYLSGDDARFRRVYNAGVLLCAVVAALGLAGVAVVQACLELLEVPPELMHGARVFLLCEGWSTAVIALTTATMNMYLATHRFVWYNFWQAVCRSSYLGSALILFLVVGVKDPGAALRSYGELTCGFNTVFYALGAGLLMRMEPRLVPSVRWMERSTVRELIRPATWNGAVIVALNLYERVGSLIMNKSFGIVGNAVWGPSLQMSSYIRQVGQGMTFGIDAVAARIGATGSHAELQRFTRHMTRLHGLVAFPAGAAMLILADPIIRAWLARSGRVDPALYTLIITTTQILAVAITSRAVSDCWERILYGSGHVRRYAPLVLVGGILNPFVAGALLLVLPGAAGETGTPRFYSPALAFATVFTFFQMFLLPIVGARCLRLRSADFLTPLLRPFLATLAASPVLLLGAGLIERWTLPRLVLVGASFGAVYGVLAYGLVLERPERTQLLRVLLRRKPPEATDRGP
ncbi:MAG: hypothetical protein JNM07_10245 [Phycisphaerae bacterium]|nr:hypothetical protein [Phycisphaerae bacterium]